LTTELTGPVPEGLSGDPHVLIRTKEYIPVDQEVYYWELEIMEHADQDEYYEREP
jgi:hypothetical protein